MAKASPNTLAASPLLETLGRAPLWDLSVPRGVPSLDLNAYRLGFDLRAMAQPGERSLGLSYRKPGFGVVVGYSTLSAERVGPTFGPVGALTAPGGHREGVAGVNLVVPFR